MSYVVKAGKCKNSLIFLYFSKASPGGASSLEPSQEIMSNVFKANHMWILNEFMF